MKYCVVLLVPLMLIAALSANAMVGEPYPEVIRYVRLGEDLTIAYENLEPQNRYVIWYDKQYLMVIEQDSYHTTFQALREGETLVKVEPTSRILPASPYIVRIWRARTDE